MTWKQVVRVEVPPRGWSESIPPPHLHVRPLSFPLELPALLHLSPLTPRALSWMSFDRPPLSRCPAVPLSRCAASWQRQAPVGRTDCLLAAFTHPLARSKASISSTTHHSLHDSTAPQHKTATHAPLHTIPSPLHGWAADTLRPPPPRALPRPPPRPLPLPLPRPRVRGGRDPRLLSRLKDHRFVGDGMDPREA